MRPARAYPGNRHGGDWKINARNLYPFLLAYLCLLIPRTESGRLCVEPKGELQESRTAECFCFGYFPVGLLLFAFAFSFKN